MFIFVYIFVRSIRHNIKTNAMKTTNLTTQQLERLLLIKLKVSGNQQLSSNDVEFIYTNNDVEKAFNTITYNDLKLMLR
jgi:hypothetical protein